MALCIFPGLFFPALPKDPKTTDGWGKEEQKNEYPVQPSGLLPCRNSHATTELALPLCVYLEVPNAIFKARSDFENIFLLLFCQTCSLAYYVRACSANTQQSLLFLQADLACTVQTLDLGFRTEGFTRDSTDYVNFQVGNTCQVRNGTFVLQLLSFHR